MLQGVAKHFREVFAALAPGGKAELVMHKRLNPPGGRRPSPEDEAAEEADGAEEGGISERYSGVGVKVSDCIAMVSVMPSRVCF